MLGRPSELPGGMNPMGYNEPRLGQQRTPQGADEVGAFRAAESVCAGGVSPSPLNVASAVASSAARGPFSCPSPVVITTTEVATVDLETLIKIELTRQKLRQIDLANRLGMPSTTFSSYLRGAVRAPNGFREDCERALGLASGALRPPRAEQSEQL